MYFNLKYDRTGALFEGKFKSQHIDTDEYLRYIYSYIYLNPVKLVPGEKEWKEGGIKDMQKVRSFLSGYEYSSMPKLVDDRPLFSSIISTNDFPKYFESVAEMEQEVLGWLANDL